MCLALRDFILSFRFLVANPRMPEKQRTQETNIHMSVNSLFCVMWMFGDHKEAGGASWGFYRSASYISIWELYILRTASLSWQPGCALWASPAGRKVDWELLKSMDMDYCMFIKKVTPLWQLFLFCTAVRFVLVWWNMLTNETQQFW